MFTKPNGTMFDHIYDMVKKKIRPALETIKNLHKLDQKKYPRMAY